MKYFVTTDGYKLSVRETGKDMSQFPDFKPFTAEQLAFYKAHPHATPLQIKNMKMPEIASFDLTLYKKEKLSILSEISLYTLHRFVEEYQFNNAVRSMAKGGTDTFYSLREAEEILETYDRIGWVCRTKFYETKKQINEATAKEQVDEIIDNAVTYYHTMQHEKTT